MRYHVRMPYKDPERQLEYQRSWMARRRSDWIKAHGPCVDCGSSDNPEVDHADASTKVNHRVWSWSKARREAELAKCVVRCRACHARKTTSEGEHARGERHGHVKLTEEKIRAIRDSDLPKRQLGRIYGVDEKNIRKIKLGQIWSHLQ